MFRTDNAIDMTMTSAGKSASDDDESGMKVVRVQVVGVLRLEMEEAMVGFVVGWE